MPKRAFVDDTNSCGKGKEPLLTIPTAVAKEKSLC
jgi:hypothetical protein